VALQHWRALASLGRRAGVVGMASALARGDYPATAWLGPRLSLSHLTIGVMGLSAAPFAGGHLAPPGWLALACCLVEGIGGRLRSA
jgi:hypothetical protein